MKRALLTVSLLTGFLGGCSSLGLGESEYSCKGYTEGYSCFSAREVYELNAAGIGPEHSHEGHEHSEEEQERARVLSKDERLYGGQSATTKAPEPVTPQPVAAPGALAPGQYMGISRITPIRTPAQVMRIWVDTYEDDAGDLHTPGIVYTEVQARSWQVGQPAPVRSQRVRATKPLARPAATQQATPP